MMFGFRNSGVPVFRVILSIENIRKKIGTKTFVRFSGDSGFQEFRFCGVALYMCSGHIQMGQTV